MSICSRLMLIGHRAVWLTPRGVVSDKPCVFQLVAMSQDWLRNTEAVEEVQIMGEVPQQLRKSIALQVQPCLLKTTAVAASSAWHTMQLVTRMRGCCPGRQHSLKLRQYADLLVTVARVHGRCRGIRCQLTCNEHMCGPFCSRREEEPVCMHDHARSS